MREVGEERRIMVKDFGRSVKIKLGILWRRYMRVFMGKEKEADEIDIY